MALQNFRHTVFERAVRAAGLDGLTPHGLRHTAASLAITNATDVKVVQEMLGHAGATTTLDLYGHLYGGRLDEIADRMDDLSAARRSGRPAAVCRSRRPSASTALTPSSADN